MKNLTLLDCTLRDGGYYNSWDFDDCVISDYLEAMKSSGVGVVELGFRSLLRQGYKGPCAYASDAFIDGLETPAQLELAVMVNASELLDQKTQSSALERMFPRDAADSKLKLVRIAAHPHEVHSVSPAVDWLKHRGYMVGLNIMQIADVDEREVISLAKSACDTALDVLYFADSLGGMVPNDVTRVVGSLRTHWSGPLGIHTHDSMGLALTNTLRAIENGVEWVDSTVTGMGRGPGNARTEELAIEVSNLRGLPLNLASLMRLLDEHFLPLKQKYAWGTNPYYYLAGKYGIHPTYIQKMLGDARFSVEDILSVITSLRSSGGKRFSDETLGISGDFYGQPPMGQWSPATALSGRTVLILGTGPGVTRNKTAVEAFIRAEKPVVIALNTQSGIDADLVSFRAACHPVRLLADFNLLAKMSQPLITPYSMLPTHVQTALDGKEVLDFGLSVEHDTFRFDDHSCTAPTSLVFAYALSIATSGQADRILLAGFDGYPGEDPRNKEMGRILSIYQRHESALNLVAITETRYDLVCESVHAMI